MELFDRVKDKTGRIGTIVCIFDGGAAYDVEFDQPKTDDPYPAETVKKEEIEKV